MTTIKKGTHEYDLRPLLTEDDWNFLESIGINTKQDNHRISYNDVKRACLKFMGTDLKTSELVSLDIIYNKVKVAF